MAEIVFHTHPLAAAEALDKLMASVTELFPADTFHLMITTNLLSPHYTEKAVRLADKNKAVRLAEIKEELASQPYVTCQNITVSGLPNGTTFVYSVQDDMIATLKAAMQDQVRNERAPRIAQAFNKHFAIRTRSEITFAALPESAQEQFKYREQLLTKLEAAAANISILGTQEARKQAEFHREKMAEMERHYQGKEQQLETAYHNKLEVLEKREEEHKLRVEAFETRESKYVRRDLLEKMQKMIENQKEVALSAKTGKKRWIIHVTFVAPMILALVLAAVFAYKLFTNPTPDWHHLTPLSAAILMFGSTLIYYIKWIDQWFKQHAQAEFRNMRFSADILRASWLAELLFEWQREKDEPMPDNIINSFSRNLFVDERWKETSHPAEALTRALGDITNIHIGKDGVEVTKKAEKPK